MNEIDELERPAKLEKLLRMSANGRIDAAIKLAEVLEAEFARLEAKPAKKPTK